MDQQTNELINNEINGNEVCLFMKGTPDAPQCGFSMAVSNILKIADEVYHSRMKKINTKLLNNFLPHKTFLFTLNPHEIIRTRRLVAYTFPQVENKY